MTQLTLLRTLSLAYLVQHPMRSVLVVLSIALGVATLVATQALGTGINKGIQEGVNPLGSLADLLVVNGQAGMPAALAKKMKEAHIDGVKDVTPFVYSRMSLVDLDNKVIWLMGVELPRKIDRKAVDVAADNALGVSVKFTYEPTTMSEKLDLLLRPPAVVSENLARELRKKVRYSPGPLHFRLRNAGRKPEVTLVGTVDFSESALPLKDSHVVVMALDSASAVCYPEDPGTINQIGVTLHAGVDMAAAQERIQEWLGTRAQVQTIQDSQRLVSDVTAGLQIGFAIGGAGALIVGLFLVYNALSVSVAERRHDIGILRSVGATRGQIACLFVGEANCMGLVGSFLGLPLGWLLAWLAIHPTANVVSELMVPIDSARIVLPGWLMILALFSGMIVADLAALVPAIQAASEEPADAVRRVPRTASVSLFLLQIAVCVLLIVLGIGMAQLRHLLPSRWGMFAGIVSLLLGGLVATPLLASFVGRALQPLFRHLFGLEGRLAADNLVRSPGRTGLVIAALAATGGLMVQTAGFLRSSHEAIREWVDEKIAADLFVTSGSSVTSGGAAISMQDNMQAKLEAIDGVEAILPIRFYRLDFTPPNATARTGTSRPGARPGKGDERIVFLVAIDTGTFVRAGKDRPLARSLQQHPELRQRGKVVVSQNFAALYNVKVGDHFPVPVRKGKVIEVEVVGTVVDYSWNRGTIILDRAWFREEFNDSQVDVFDLFLKPGADVDAVRQDIMDRYGASEALFVVTRQYVHDDVQKTMHRVYGLAYAQQAVVGMVALLGVVSALFISVLQRRRELGLLRAVGASRPQILRSVLAEAVLMGAVGAVVGFAIGLLLEWYVLDVLLLDEAGFIFPMRIPWFEAGLVTTASVVLATLAGLWPAYLATRLRIPEAIAYE
jgi:putative ABC transport system permease protein